MQINFKGNCPVPTIRNGYIMNTNVRHAQWALFRCNYGYLLKGRRDLECNNGQWSNELPICVGKF